MKKLLFFIVLLSSNQMFAAEGDDSGRRPGSPTDEPAAKRQRTDYSDNAVTGAAAGIPQSDPYPLQVLYTMLFGFIQLGMHNEAIQQQQIIIQRFGREYLEHPALPLVPVIPSEYSSLVALPVIQPFAQPQAAHSTVASPASVQPIEVKPLLRGTKTTMPDGKSFCTCEDCGQKLSDPTSLSRHYSDKHLGSTVMKCPECNRILTRKDNCKRHLKFCKRIDVKAAARGLLGLSENQDPKSPDQN